MIKLIASDIDGTLLMKDQKELDPQLFAEIRRLQEKGIAFAPCSGRQYYAIKALFGPVADDIYYISENGACVFGPGSEGELLYHNRIDHELAVRACRDILTDPRCQLMLCTPRKAYLVVKNDRFDPYLTASQRVVHEVIASPEEAPDAVCKISVYCEHGLEESYEVFHLLRERWQDTFDVAIAGDWWVDLNLADKSTGVGELGRLLGIDSSEVMAFGDNYNDLPMLKFAGTGYMMDSAAPELRKMFPNLCTSVMDVLKQL